MITFIRPKLVWDVWVAHANNHPKNEAIIHSDVLGASKRWTYQELIAAAMPIAGQLLERGIKAGDVCALIIRPFDSMHHS